MVDTQDIQPVTQPQDVVGIDLGVTVLATPSRGEAIAGPKAHKALLKRLRRTSRALSRKRRGSHRAAKAKLRLARLHARITNIRKDAIQICRQCRRSEVPVQPAANSPGKKDDPAIKEWSDFMDKYFPEGDKTSTFSVYGYATAQTLVQVLKQCDAELTRENVMKQAANLKDFELGLLLPGIKINTGPADYFPIEQMLMSRVNGEHSELSGQARSGELGTQQDKRDQP